MSRRPSRPHRIALIAAATGLAAACSTVLGLDDYKDAIDKLCQCDNLPDCKKTLETKLDAADESAVRDWLASYDQLNCDSADCNTNGLRCFYTAPGNCTAKDAACSVSQQCCGFGFDSGKEHTGAGCCAAGGGTCCDHCLTCAETIGMDKPDVDLVCLSGKVALNAVLSCKKANCEAACTIPATCASCMLKNCKNPLDACDKNKAP